ncbi:hypothetical protein FZC76_21695 [Sutcliffiella horikoshii]|uniref:Uncharacterized protein n=1 Tax=Sutcliffiella horikoshii TaxID=79883 RepID=A0A5D4SA14_9BACI|nr:hypothetical protein [Sutcliffiella horikoshii]TYS60487.1 hypothetical protein FZC76_21695 [Sutcliffiella horikoshii]
MSKQFYILNLIFWSLGMGVVLTQTYIYHKLGTTTPVVFMNGLSLGMITVLIVVYSILLYKKVKEEGQ